MFFFRNKTGLISAAAALAAALSLFSHSALSAEKEPVKTHVVHIQGMLFTPAKLQISSGDSVTWINEDILMHAVKSTDMKNAWQSKDLMPHQSWTKTFEQACPYICPYHPTMMGEIAVAPARASEGH